MTLMPSENAPQPEAPQKERLLLWTLAAVQFTHILDFMIVMPLGPRFMEIFAITPGEFGFMVSVYTWSAGVFGLLASGIIDRFDRKKTLLVLYAGFALGTLACALAPNYPFLVAARLVAGGFGGLTGATVLAVVGDVIPMQRRGAAMGTVFTAFSIASIAGVPFGLFLSNHFGWHATFFLITGLAAAISCAAYALLPPLRSHLVPGERPSPWAEMKAILGVANHWRAFALTVTMTAAGFLVVPYISPSLVANAGLSNEQLPLVYLFGGSVTFFSLRWLGRLSDRIGLLKVFTAVSVLAAGPLLAVTLLRPAPLWILLGVTTAFMVLTSGRFVPGMAMITSSVEPRFRGGFMTVNSALQQMASGLAAMTAGAVIVKGPAGTLDRYPWVGALGVLCIVLSLVLARRLRQAPGPAASGAKPR
jgi:predicted MFS family arabinose efflux permease